MVVSVLQVRPDKRYRLAVGSFKEDTHNYVEIIQREWSSPLGKQEALTPWDADGRHNSTASNQLSSAAASSVVGATTTALSSNEQNQGPQC